MCVCVCEREREERGGEREIVISLYDVADLLCELTIKSVVHLSSIFVISH